MNWEELISEDRLASTADLYAGVMQRIARKGSETKVPVFRKAHIGMSIAAGILLGLLIGGIQYTGARPRCQTAQEWYGQFYTHEMEIEYIELKLFENEVKKL